MNNYKIIQEVWDDLPDKDKWRFNPAGPYDRLKIQQIGDPSGNAVVYELNGGDWVAKVNTVGNGMQQLFSQNMDLISGVLKGDIDRINRDPTMARVAVYDTKIEKPGSGVAVTFEKRMFGQSLQSLFEKGHLPPPEKLCKMLNKVKRTLEYLFRKHRFNHNDLHYGNLFVTPEFEPVIFDFDWSTMDTNATYNKLNILHGIIQTYQNMAKFKSYDYKPQSISPNCSGRNKAIGPRDAWFLIQNAYSIMAKKNDHTDPKEYEDIKKTDMAMLVNYIIVKLCKIEESKPGIMNDYRHIFANRLDDSLTLDSGKYFDCKKVKNDETYTDMEWNSRVY